MGTRYHGLHHLFPSIPYHNLGIAHRRLRAGLPADSIYHECERVSLFGAIAELWHRSSQAAARNPLQPKILRSWTRQSSENHAHV